MLASVRRHRTRPARSPTAFESSSDLRSERRCSFSGPVNQTYGFLTRGSVIGGESISLRASKVINQTADSFSTKSRLTNRRSSMTPVVALDSMDEGDKSERGGGQLMQLHTIMRSLTSLTLGVLGAWVTALNYSCIVLWYASRQHHSFIPMIGGLSLALALLACPMKGTMRLAWLPLVADPGCLLVTLLLGYVVIKTHGFHHESNKGESQDRMQS